MWLRRIRRGTPRGCRAGLASCQRGAVAVEAALVAPVLIALIMGTMEYGLLLFTYSSMQSAGREVTRQIAVNYAAAADAETLVKSRLPTWSRASTTIKITQSAPADPSTNIIAMTISVPARKATPLNFFLALGGGWTLSTEVRMKQELPL